MRRLILRGLSGLLLLLVVAVVGLWLWVRGSLPQTEGELAVAGLTAAVQILRDEHGIVTIKAETLADAHFALGYAHAQDRLAQMDLMRRTGAGRLSEVVGDGTVRFDRYMRTLGLGRLAEASLAHLEPEVRASLEAYAAGVNAFLDDDSARLPPEFLVLGYRPEPWRPADSLIWGRLMALQLSFNWHTEIRRLLMAADLSAEQIAFLWPDYPGRAPTTISDLARQVDPEALTRLTRILPWELAPKDASNAWAVSGARSASGAPLLANDPHLSLSAPGTWYLARIETPEITLAGATAPGVPLLILGHNGQIAWGFTTTHSDTQDIFIERLVDGDPARYEAPGGPLPFTTREEVIAVKGGNDQLLRVRETRHGPVISDLEPEAMAQLDPDQVLALAWTALADDDQTVNALYRVNRATGWDDFLEALRSFHSPQQNIVYADGEGTIGFVAPARVPLRKRGDGSLPVPGWSGEFDWQGLIPFEELPRQVNPGSGRIITANNKIVPESYPHLIAKDWPDPYRAQRIAEVLEAAPASTLEQHTALQVDSLSVAARELLPLLLARVEGGDVGPREALTGWDFVMARDRPEPLIFYAWLRALNRALLADELGSHFEGFGQPDPILLTRILTEAPAWCDDRKSEAEETCAQIVTAALERALAALAEELGGDWTDWRWGDLHRMRYAHTFWQQVPVIGGWLAADIAVDGGSFTVNRAAVSFAGPLAHAFESRHGAGYRAVYDLADLDNSRFIIAGGQSGHPLSPHYGSLVTHWRDGRTIKLVGPETAAEDRLVLVPQ